MRSDKNKSSIEEDLSNSPKSVDTDTSSDLIRLVDYIQNPKNIEANTVLDDNEQVVALTMMNWAGQVFDIEPFKQFVASYPKYKISGDDGRGRRETIQIAEAIRKEEMDRENRYLDLLRRK